MCNYLLTLIPIQIHYHFALPYRDAKAMYSCEAEHSNELSFPQGAHFSNGKKWHKRKLHLCRCISGNTIKITIIVLVYFKKWISNTMKYFKNLFLLMLKEVTAKAVKMQSSRILWKTNKNVAVITLWPSQSGGTCWVCWSSINCKRSLLKTILR